MSEDRLTQALTALREADVDLDADPKAEIHALLAFRRQRRRRQLRRLTISMAMSAAAVTAALLFAGRIYETPVPAVALNRPSPMPPSASVPGPEPVASPTSPSIQDPEEIATVFYPLMVSAPPLERGLLVRVTVPASTMRSFGLSIGDDHLSDPVEADVLVGQDDLARAIRFVSYRR